MKPLGAVVNNAAALDAAGKLNSPIRRQLLGLELASAAAAKWDPLGVRARTFESICAALAAMRDSGCGKHSGTQWSAG